ncbi:MAG TPA: hypothetical protein VGP93_12700 [Polyangiaceae bacterium]|nr:hypothetical protein [Polyangiaceae bacterium]
MCQPLAEGRPGQARKLGQESEAISGMLRCVTSGSSTSGRRLRRWALALWAALAATGCRCSRDRATGEDRLACRAACNTYLTSSCSGQAHGARDQAECTAECAAESELAERAGCHALRLGFLECAAREKLACDAIISAPPVALERGEGAPSCSERWRSLQACTAACRDPGTVHVGQAKVGGKEVLAELVRDGCDECQSKVRPGAPPGSSCQAARVCAEQCCACDAGPAHYRARACIDGGCADQPAACSAAPAAVGHDPCP